VTRRVQLLPAAQKDAEWIFEWLCNRSPPGAVSWAVAFKIAVASLAEGADRHASASEASRLKRPLRQTTFKTEHGKRYRLVFIIADEEVRILRVRAPGQKPLRNADFD